MEFPIIILFSLIILILILITAITAVIVSRKRKKMGMSIEQMEKLKAAVSQLNIH